MHAPNHRLPVLIEGAVLGEHMENVELVTGDFGMGQNVFEAAAQQLRDRDPRLKDLTAADLQAILWFAEKAYWESAPGRRLLARRAP